MNGGLDDPGGEGVQCGRAAQIGLSLTDQGLIPQGRVLLGQGDHHAAIVLPGGPARFGVTDQGGQALRFRRVRQQVAQHAGYAREILILSGVLCDLLPDAAEAQGLAALVRYAEARRPARQDDGGVMVPLSEQDPALWDQALIGQAETYLRRAAALDAFAPRVIQAAIHGAWCARRDLGQPAPWPDILALYDMLLTRRDDAVIRLNRAVALAEVRGAPAALAEIEALDGARLTDFAPYHAVRADLLERVGRTGEAATAVQAALDLGSPPAERAWLEAKLRRLRA